MTRTHLPSLAALLILTALWPQRAHAAEPPTVSPGPHRLSLGIGTEGMLPGINRDANWVDATVGLGFSAGYAYRLIPNLELGAQAAFWVTNSRAPNVFMPALSLRGSVPLTHTGRTELGLTGRAGLLTEYVHDNGYDKTWNGTAFTIAADVRERINTKLAYQLSLELTSGGARSNRTDFYSAQDPTYTALGVWFRLVWMP